MRVSYVCIKEKTDLRYLPQGNRLQIKEISVDLHLLKALISLGP